MELDSAIARQNVAKEGYTTFYVDGSTGNDAANFLRWETAAKTIQAAIDKAESWAKIYVKAGTYAENVVINKEGINFIGEKRDTVIIQPTTGNAITVSTDNCTVTTLKAIGEGINKSGIHVTGDRCIIDNCEAGGTGTRGITLWDSDRSIVRNCYVNSTTLSYPLLISGGVGSTYIKIHNNYLKTTHITGIGIYVHLSTEAIIFENEIVDNPLKGLLGMGTSSNNSIFHNNFISNGTQVEDGGNNKIFENFYDDHTVDTNNDGLCDTPYTFTTGVDYAPVSKRNGWLQESLGISSSSSITIANIFSAVNAILTLTETGGTLTTDGAVQNLYINETPAGVFAPKIVQIDFSNQTAAETVVVRENYRIKSGGGYIEKDAVIFTGLQDPLLKNIKLEENRFGVKVTIEKTAGANKDYDWEVLYKA